MAETISEPVYGVCLTCRINFSLRAEAVKKNFSLSLNLMFTSPDAQVFLLITVIISLEYPKPDLLTCLMVHCIYVFMAKMPWLCFSEFCN